MSSSRDAQNLSSLRGLGVLVGVAAFVWGAWISTRPVESGVSEGKRVLRPGVIHHSIVDKSGPWHINVVEIDLRQPDLHIESGRATDHYQGREAITSLVGRKSDFSRYVVAAINGDYFNLETGESQNNHILGGEFVKAFASPGHHHELVDIPNSQFAITWDKRPLIDQFVFAGTVRWADGKTSALTGVNIVPRRGGLVIFNHWVGESTPGEVDDNSVAAVGLAVVRISKDTMICVGTTPLQFRANTSVPHDGIVLAGFKQWRSGLDSSYTAGDTVRILLRMLPANGTLRELVGGWPRIVRNGKSIFESNAFPENLEASVFSKRHPRTGIGFSADSSTLYFLTVDGRQETSVGMSLPELAKLMISIGVAEGLNLDGGGSTTLVVNGGIVNSPSDPTGERPVGNCIMLVAQHAAANNARPQ